MVVVASAVGVSPVEACNCETTPAVRPPIPNINVHTQMTTGFMPACILQATRQRKLNRCPSRQTRRRCLQRRRGEDAPLADVDQPGGGSDGIEVRLDADDVRPQPLRFDRPAVR